MEEHLLIHPSKVLGVNRGPRSCLPVPPHWVAFWLKWRFFNQTVSYTSLYNISACDEPRVVYCFEMLKIKPVGKKKKMEFYLYRGKKKLGNKLSKQKSEVMTQTSSTT